MPESHRTSTFIMMKKVLFMLAMLTCIFASCSDGGSEDINPTPKPDDVKYEITIDASIISNGLSFDTKAGEGSISFTANANWTLTVASTTSGATWCKASATSGTKGSATVKFTVEENTGYEDRSVSVTIKAGTASKTFSIIQKGADALLVTTNKYEVVQEGGTIEVEVKANIDYSMEISETAKGWISEASSRALKSYKHTFNIASNEEAENREGEITFKSGDKVETVKVYQAGGAIIMLTQDEYIVSDAGEMITVEIKSNIEFGVQMPDDVDWIVDEASSRGMSSHTLNYYIEPNEGYDSRSAEIIFFDKNSNLQDTLKVIQAQKDAIVISEKIYDVKAEGETIEVKLSANVDFEVAMPDVDWIEQVSSRALTDHTLYFKVAENDGEESRSAEIVFIDKDFQVSDSILINQQVEMVVAELKTAGTLKNVLGNKYKEITSLKVVGPINGDDVYVLRKMLGASSFSEADWGKLAVLDLSEASIIKGGDYYYGDFYTSDNIIGESMFYKCNNLQEISLPQNVVSIEHYAFYGCSEMSKITMFEEVTSIGWYAFSECKSIKNIVLPDKIDVINPYAFSRCTNLESVVIPNGRIGHSCFYSCTSLSAVVIGDGVDSIEEDAFFRCDALSTIIMGNGITKVGKDAFAECSTSISVTVNSLSSWLKIEFENSEANPMWYGGNLYSNDKLVTELIVPETNDSIKPYAFYGCKSIKNIEIPKNVTFIGNEAFFGIPLTSCVIPDNVTSIGKGAFSECDSLITITFGNGIKEIPSNVLAGCTSLTEVQFGKNVKQIAHDTFGVSSKLPIRKVVCYATVPPTCLEDSEKVDGNVRHYFSAFYVAWKEPFYHNQNNYGNVRKSHSKLSDGTNLYIPDRCGAAYKSSQWGSAFKNIIEMD